ncbi:hypothetical protein RRG08_013230 [Elysia crispata]|uniref:Hexosyltransferase n=1 Tax=Elysia crispata TaxID=231223 RepID=A0AAE1DYT3_9GAST|nr:hypothetical protein RRG08_013230 [Elysia crispata]
METPLIGVGGPSTSGLTMQWVARGEVRLPVRYIYLAVIVLLSAYFLAREISNVGSRRRQNGCTGLREDLLHQKSPPVRGDQQDQHDQQAMQNEIHGRSERVCWRKPTQTTYCPHCFQPAAYRLSKKLQPVSHSSLSFPRGPPFLFQPRNTRQQRSVDDYLITPWAVCRPHWRCPYLLAIQLSIAGDVERRLAVRSTWGSVAKTQTWPHTLINGGVQVGWNSQISSKSSLNYIYLMWIMHCLHNSPALSLSSLIFLSSQAY